MVARSRSVLQEQTVEVMEVLAVRSVAVVWRRSLQMEGRPGAVQPNGCRTKGGGPGGGGGLEVLEASNLEGAAWRARWWLLIQRVSAVASTRRRRPGGPGGGGGGVLEGPAASWRARRRPGGPGGGGSSSKGLRRRSWRRRWPGGPGGVQPGRGGMEGQVVAPHPKGLEAANLEGLETAEVLEATAGLEAEANLEVLESVGLEGLEAAAAAILEADYLEADCGDHPGGPGGGVHLAAVGLEGPAAAAAAAAPHPAVGPVEVLEETVPAVEVRRRLVIRPTSSSSMEGKLFLQVNLINEKIKERSHELVVSPFGD
ncbi:unnamed protein product [Boreogadus saida]